LQKIAKNLISYLEKHGFKGAVVPVCRVKDLQSGMKIFLDDKNLNKDLYIRYLSRINFQIPESIPETGSIIIVAAQQPQVAVKFNFNRQEFSFAIPPTYSTQTDNEVVDCLTGYLDKNGYRILNAILPEKQLAVHSGLATYGKNNIAYINGWGSFFRLTSYYSDMPPGSDKWNDFNLLDQCADCNACIKKCPTKAISNNEIRILAERCLTFMNEGPDEYPEWVDPRWHKCLIGCMLCQNVCPVNRQFSRYTEFGCSFTEAETVLILQRSLKDTIPGVTANKLKNLGMFEEYEAFRRNLQLLLKDTIYT
jgi:epoxyqueuosine reductase